MNRRSRIPVASFAALTLAILASTANPQSGQLDASFGDNGVLAVTHDGVNPVYGDVRAMAAQPDGRIVFVGRAGGGGWLVCCLDSAGVLLWHRVFPGDLATDVALQADGRIVVVGPFGLPSMFTVRRLEADGDDDVTFGSGGLVETDISRTESFARAVLVQAPPDERILVTGGVFNRKGYMANALARYLPNGDLDPTFGPPAKKNKPRAGYLVEDPNTKLHDGLFEGALAQLPDGTIYAAGNTAELSLGNLNWDGWSIMRYHADGTPDETFQRIEMTEYGTWPKAWLRSLDLQSVGGETKLLATGRLVAPGGDPESGVLLARYDLDGQLDTSFGAGGFVAYSAVWTCAIGDSTVVAPADGRITMGVYLLDPAATALRFLPDGSLDPSFDGDGIGELTPPGSCAVYSAAFAADGGSLIGGALNEGSGNVCFIAKYVQ